ncbi:MAG: hypothetical protein ACOY71_04735 [Gemmatimonadota bacterium]
MYEYHTQPLLPRRAFALRLARHGLVLLAVVGFSLVLGTTGFHFLSRLGWTDAFLNAAMLLSGMGPVGDLGPTAGRLFAACYALYSGFFLLFGAGLMLAPVFHRMLHMLHLDLDEDARAAGQRRRRLVHPPAERHVPVRSEQHDRADGVGDTEHEHL